MSNGVNKVILIGNLGADPETRYMASGDAVTHIRMATNESWKDQKTGELQERTEWHRVMFFRRLGEIAAQYLRTGSQVYIEGRLRTRKYDKDGQTHYSTEIVCDNMQMLSPRSDTSNSTPREQSTPAPASEADTDLDDDIPF